MLHRQRIEPPEYIYPADPWNLVEKRFNRELLAQTETIFATANGYLGIRGYFEEGSPVSEPGTFVNGFYESWPIIYGEEAHGFAKTGQTMLRVPNSALIRLYVDDEPFYLWYADLPHFERRLNMREGTLDREVLWETPGGRRVSIVSRRLVSFEHRHLAAISFEVNVLNADAPVALASEIVLDRRGEKQNGDPRKAPRFAEGPLWPRMHYADGLRAVLAHGTRDSQMTLGCGIDHVLDTDCEHSASIECKDDFARVVFQVQARRGHPVRLTKYMAYHGSRTAAPEEICSRTERSLDRAAAHGFEALLEGQRRYVGRFWERSDVQVDAEPRIQQSLRWNLFQLLQASARAEGAGIGARGLTGSVYEGHYFWDTEIYVLPFLTHTSPRIARNLLRFRHSHLEQARQGADMVGQKGAKFPWRTINGEEASAYYAAGTAQYHINADIMYALRRYVDSTGDDDLLHDEGAEMLVETARLWVDIGFYSERRDGKFCIHGVTGPDEYNTVVDNNAFTNLMAKDNLRYAVSTVKTLQAEDKEAYATLVHRTGLLADEVDSWKRAADSMYIPYDERLSIHPQDDSFLDKKPWDFEGTPPGKYPLLLNYHPLVIYRHRVIKQADVVLAMFLLGQEFTEEQKKRNFDYYDPLTTGDSSLSVCIQSILASEIGYREKAYEYFLYALAMDLADIGGNVKNGAHIASIGGTWLAVVCGFAGMRSRDGQLHFDPWLPQDWKGLRFPLAFRGCRLDVDIAPDQVTYRLREGKQLKIIHRGQEVVVAAGKPISFAIDPPQQP